MFVKLKNDGTVNKNRVILTNNNGQWIQLYFSYETIIAFIKQDGEIVCRQNDWSTTTGKYLNEIQPDKSKRITGEEFENKVSELLSGLKF